jgi:putative flippase GtrA
VATEEDPVPVPLVEVAIPVYNEEEILESSIRKLRSYLDESFPFSASIVIVDNASVDRTWAIATGLSLELTGVSAIHLDEKGKGLAIRTAWGASRSPIVAYMDADLSTGLDGLLPLIAPLVSGHSQLSIGSRIDPGARVLRGAKREFISRSYNLLLRGALRCNFSDAQCGFKAMRRDAVDPLMGLVKDQHWFFDTELLLQAERQGLRIHEVPVDWIDDPDSRVNIGGAIKDDLRGVWRLSKQGFGRNASGEPFSQQPNDPIIDYHGELARYASVGIASTIACLALFFILRSSLGIFGANLAATAITTAVNTFAHARFTFRRRAKGRTRYAVITGMCSFAVAIGLTSATLAFTYLIGRTSPAAEAVAIIVGMIAASCVRFVLLREWAFRTHARSIRSDTSAEAAVPVERSRAA